MREFSYELAAEGPVPLLIGITGYSGAGKTFSALRLATGIQKVVGGDIAGIDTEGKRMLQYAKRFSFRHVPFEPPFGPDDYREAIDFCVKKESRIIVIDSMSHEHEGPGGVLEQSEAYLDAKCGDNWEQRKKYQQLSWQKPKAARKRLNQRIVTQLPHVVFIFCYRGQEKQKLVKGEDPIQLGTQAITTSPLVYDMTIRFLLRPGSDGNPAEQGETPAEKMMMKTIETFRGWSEIKGQLSEALGEKLARWARPQLQAQTRVPCFIKQFPAWGGKPLEGAPADVLGVYIQQLTEKRDEQLIIPPDERPPNYAKGMIALNQAIHEAQEVFERQV